MSPHTKFQPIRFLLPWLIATSTSAVLAATIPDTPLQAATSADPNIVMILDDSGSMHWEITPDSYSYFVFPRPTDVYGTSNYTSYVSTTEDSEPYNAYTRSPQTNPSYYNPAITYLPWAKADGSLWPNAAPSAAYHNPAKTSVGTRNLTIQNNQNAYWEKCTSTSWGDCTTSAWGAQSFWPSTYFWYNGGDKWTRSSYTKVEIKSSTASYSGHGRTARTDCSSGTCTYAQEIQNFANWYTYYRSRVLTARAGVGRAFAAQGDALRVGYATINKSASDVDGVSTRALVSGVRIFTGSSRDLFFTNLYERSIPRSNTPLRRALGDIGEYYRRTDSRGPWSTTPGTSGGNDYACRQSYAILMTDGYWTEGADYQASASGAQADNDSTDGPTHTGPNDQNFTYSAISPYRDGRSNTLADVASFYWKNDLYPTLTNAVPTSAKNPAFWQHMVTFGVGLGVSGTISPDFAFAQIDATSPQTVTWPNPTASNTAKLDDLLHAAVNSRGNYFSAQNPAEFSTALSSILSDIVSRKSSSASVSTNSTKLTSSSLVFSATFNTNKWEGELEAYSINVDGLSDTPKWKASEKIPDPAARKIFTTTGGTVKEFTWVNLSSTDQTAIGSSDIVDYIRGVRTNESSQGGTLRDRASALGDIVHSSPYYSRDSKLVLIGANDGMLHGFDSETGTERFAYIPSSLIPKLAQLSQKNYQHKFYVDGEISVGEQSQTFLDKTYAVVALGRGGKGLFSLDITNPSSFSASNVVWEYLNTSDRDLGFMLGKPVIARMNDDTTVAIIGNGYNSTDGKAVLYIINLITGSVTKIDTKIGSDNGLATPGVRDVNGDGYIDYIYAGDLKGNVWKFDVSSSNNKQWGLGNGGSPIFIAKDSLGNLQPITAQITLAKNYVRGDPNLGKTFLFFGTGAYFRQDDPSDKAIQSWYAIIDEGSTISGRSALKRRSLESVFTVDGKSVRSFSKADIRPEDDVHDMTGWKGWYIDWINPDGSKLGERITTPSAFYRFTEPTLLVSSIIPSTDDPCQPGGTGYLNAVNAFTGGSLSESFFLFDNYAGTTAIGSLDLGLGMPSQASIFISDDPSGQLVVSGSGTGGSSDEKLVNTKKVNTGVAPRGRLSWREIIRK